MFTQLTTAEDCLRKMTAAAVQVLLHRSVIKERIPGTRRTS